MASVRRVFRSRFFISGSIGKWNAVCTAQCGGRHGTPSSFYLMLRWPHSGEPLLQNR
ncbi:Uncharacterised protein [Bordetella pertussis]|nr:Uncharacterised protein [Bordetella pertussis]